MDIIFNSVELNDDAVTIDNGSKLPCLIIQYDPPWDETSVGDHYHYLPLDAIADAQMIFGLGSDMEGVEFHVLNHAVDVELSTSSSSTKGLRSLAKGLSPRDRRIEKDKALRALMNQVGDTLVQEAWAVDLADAKSMKQEVFKISTEMGDGDISMARTALAAPMATARSSLLDSFLGDAEGHSINRDADGYANLQSILDDNSDRIEASRKRVLDMKYGHHIHMVIAQRLHEENLRKVKGK